MTMRLRAASNAVVALALGYAGTGAYADPAAECGVHAVSQVEIGNCLKGVESDVDATVKQALGFAMTSARSLDKETGRDSSTPALTAAQAAWESYRDAHCAFVGTTFGGGSGTGIAIQSCRIELGRARARQLMDFVN